MSGKGFSLDRFLGIKQPAEGTAGTFQTIIAAIDHPCVAMMPGYGILAGAAGEQNIDRMQQLLEAAEEAFGNPDQHRSEEHTSELQSLMRISYAVFVLNK